jgi:hypothetical protein
VTESFLFAPRSVTPPGIYQLSVGLYRVGESGPDARAVPVASAGLVDNARRVRTGTLEVVSNPLDEPRTFSRSPPDVKYPLNVDLGWVRYLGHDIGSQELKPGGKIQITLYFEVLSKPRPTHKLFEHLVGPKSSNLDRLWIGGRHPPSEWEPGEFIANPQTIATSANDPAGDYDLVLGIWDEALASKGIEARLMPVGEDVDTTERRIRVVRLHIGP